MKTTGKVTAWLCIFSSLLMGCYSSALVDPVGEDKEDIQSHDIAFVVLKDSRKYVFDEPPAIIGDTIVGQISKVIGSIEVTIPASEVTQCYESQPGEIGRIVTRAGTSYIFENPPAFVDKSLVGEAKEKGMRPMRVSLAVSDVAEVGVKKFDVGATVGLVVCTSAAVGMVVYTITHDGGGSSPRPSGTLWRWGY